MPTISPLSRPSQLSESVSNTIEQWICDGSMAPGVKLPTEKALSTQFGVSRAVVREAISRLKAEGYVHSRQGAGAFVMARPGLESFRLAGRGEAASDDVTADIFELRYIVETAAAALAARRRTRDDLAVMREALVTMGARLACRGDGTQADDDFHIAIAAATGNPMIQRFARFMGNQFYASRVPTWNEEGHAEGRAQDAQDEHQAIFDAIAAGDPMAAHAAARNHLVQAAHRLGMKTDHWDKEIR
ncbi:MAG: FadR family transcriptional regulator [Rhodocyclaceae bacterium]|nr:FadR family transcriptional regulator [Rhodocyclaceae bacterium]MCB1962326.1 FadR family transcriptional regulator [Rhodocyclaceae bacterium]